MCRRDRFFCVCCFFFLFSFFFQAEDGIRDRSPSRGLGDVYKRQPAGSLVDGGNREYIFAMRMRDKDELQKDARFDILVFEHTEKFCQDVYELMQESLPAGSAVFKKI